MGTMGEVLSNLGRMDDALVDYIARVQPHTEAERAELGRILSARGRLLRLKNELVLDQYQIAAAQTQARGEALEELSVEVEQKARGAASPGEMAGVAAAAITAVARILSII